MVRSFMAHHQGMSLCRAFLLQNRPCSGASSRTPRFRPPCCCFRSGFQGHGVLLAHDQTCRSAGNLYDAEEMPGRVYKSPDTSIPEVQLLSNGRYHVMITNAGGGYSRWKDLAVTRWREDSTRDNWGAFCYIRGPRNGAFWSTTYPACSQILAAVRGRNFGRTGGVSSSGSGLPHPTEIAVSPEDDIELRGWDHHEQARTSRTIEVTSYAEVVLASSAQDALHPAFSNLFGQTEIIREQTAILCTRRPRSMEEQSHGCSISWQCTGPRPGSLL